MEIHVYAEQSFKDHQSLNIKHQIAWHVKVIVVKLKIGCHYSCLNCTGRSSNECNSCWDLENRIL